MRSSPISSPSTGTGAPTPALALSVALAAAGAVCAATARAQSAPSAKVLEGGRRHARALAVALHGGSWKGASPEELAERTLTELSSAASRAGLRLLVPCAPADQSGADGVVPWLTPAGEARVLSLLDDEVAAGRADRQRLYLVGHGAGATGALTLAARHPDRIAAVAAWSGTPEPLWDRDRRVVGLAGDVIAGLSTVPVYLWTGSDDRALDADALRLFVAGMQRTHAADTHAADASNTRPRRGDAPRTFVWEQAPGGHGYGPEGPEPGLRFVAGHRLRPAPRVGTRPG